MDGLNTPLELMNAAKNLGQTAIAITDHGTLSSHRDMQKAAMETGRVSTGKQIGRAHV